MDLYTAVYRYPGLDRFDITVKGNDHLGRIFAPTWDMVRGVKNGTLTKEDYARRYMGKVTEVMANPSNINILTEIRNRFPNSITLVCFCKRGDFCHRYLLALLLQGYEWGQYKGERIL